LAGQATLAAEFIRPQECDDGFLALLGNDAELELAFLEVENRVRDIALREDGLSFLVSCNGLSFAHAGEKFFWIERSLDLLSHAGFLFFLREFFSAKMVRGYSIAAVFHFF
jgi:hypothetical protein